MVGGDKVEGFQGNVSAMVEVRDEVEVHKDIGVGDRVVG